MHRPLLPLLCALLGAPAVAAGDLELTGTYGEDFVPAPGDQLSLVHASSPGLRVTSVLFELKEGVVFDPEQTDGFPGEVIDQVGSSGFDGNFVYGDPFFQPVPEPRTVYGTLELSFSNLDSGEEVLVLLDVDQAFGTESFVPGPDFAGSTLTVTFDNGSIEQVGAGVYATAGVDASVAVSGALSAPAVELVRLGVPANPNAFLPGQTSAPIVGATWDPRIDHGSFVPGSVLDFVLVTGGPANVPLGAEGTLLCDPVSPVVVLIANPTPGTAFSIPVPDRCAPVGLPLCAQGGAIDAVLALHWANALDITLGTF